MANGARWWATRRRSRPTTPRSSRPTCRARTRCSPRACRATSGGRTTASSGRSWLAASSRVLIARFLALRLAVAVPVVLGILFLTFMLIRIGHQDPVAMLAGPLADAATYQMIRAELQLDKPLWQQFVVYVQHLLQGDLGRSWQGSTPVLQEIITHFPITLELVVLAVGLAALIGIPVGIRAAMRPNGWFDQLSRFGALTAFSIPTYWMGLM